MTDSLDAPEPVVWMPVRALRDPREKVIASAQSDVLSEWLSEVAAADD